MSRLKSHGFRVGAKVHGSMVRPVGVGPVPTLLPSRRTTVWRKNPGHFHEESFRGSARAATGAAPTDSTLFQGFIFDRETCRGGTGAHPSPSNATTYVAPFITNRIKSPPRSIDSRAPEKDAEVRSIAGNLSLQLSIYDKVRLHLIYSMSQSVIGCRGLFS
jgi:hypothetical protein